jgi:hypothetical protein
MLSYPHHQPRYFHRRKCKRTLLQQQHPKPEISINKMKPMKSGDLIRFVTAVAALYRARNNGKSPPKHVQFVDVRCTNTSHTEDQFELIAEVAKTFVRRDKQTFIQK